MSGPILGLHHVTATVAQAQDDLDFFVGVLGMRLVKKTVNFDNHGVYHFYYGNELGTPGTLMTTFPYTGKGVGVGTKGAGQVTVTSFSVPGGSLDAWRDRLGRHGIDFAAAGTRFGEEVLALEDPSGLQLELIESDDDDRQPYLAQGLDAGTAIRGLHSVTLALRDPAASLPLLTQRLGYEVVGEEGGRTRVAAGGERAGHYVDLLPAPDAPAAVNGLGTVHHVAHAIADAEQQLSLRAELLRLGYHVTEVRDRQYFRSIYFREPGGVLYEVATLRPGFTVDEGESELGRNLRLPPDAEAGRTAVEAALPLVRLPD